MRTLVNHVAGKDTYLHSIAKRCLDRIHTFVDKREGRDEVRMSLVVSLQSYGGLGFDKLTKTKTLEELVRGMGPEGLEAYAGQMLGRLGALLAEAPAEEDKKQKEGGDQEEEEDDDDEEEEGRRRRDVLEAQRRALDQLASVLRMPALPEPARESALKHLAVLAFFRSSGEAAGAKKGGKKAGKAPASSGELAELLQRVSDVQLAEPVRQAVASRLLSLVEDLAAQSRHRPGKDQQPQQPRRDYLSAVSGLCAAAASDESARILSSLSAETSQREGEVRSKLALLESVVKRAAEGPQDQLGAARVATLARLCQLLGLYLLSDAGCFELDLIEDLAAAVDRMASGEASEKGNKAKGKKREEEAGAQEEEESQPMDVLLDILLSLLSTQLM